MSPSDIQLVSAIVGLVGSLISAAFTFGLEPYPLAQCGGDDDVAFVNARNKRRKVGQTCGLSLIAISFLLQIFSAL